MLFKENTIVDREEYASQQLKFVSSDNEEMFEKNKTHPKMLSKYLNPNNPLIYSYNSMGYRTKEFSSFKENEFILVMGCSYTEGIGLHEEDIWHSHISQEFNLPVMNLGLGGTGPDMVMFNSIQYIKNNYPKPKMVIVQWPGEYRKYFCLNQDLLWTSIPNMTEKDYYNFNREQEEDIHWYNNRYLIYDSHEKHSNYKNITTTKLLWESQGIPYMNWAYQDDQLDSYDHITWVNVTPSERARDMAHPGPTAHVQTFSQIVEDVRKCLNG